MITNDEWRKALNRPDLSDKEMEEFAQGIRNIIAQHLDHYFHEEFESDD
jgi:hypothetical protein